jgi:hypothetical protein
MSCIRSPKSFQMQNMTTPSSILWQQQDNFCRQATKKRLAQVCGSWSEPGPTISIQNRRANLQDKSTLCTHRMTHYSIISVQIITTCHTNNPLHCNRAQMYLIKITVCWPDTLACFLACILTHCTLQLCSVAHQATAKWFNTLPQTQDTWLPTYKLFVTANFSILRCKPITVSAVLKTKWWHEGVSLHLTSCSCMMVVLPLTTVFTEQRTKLFMGQIKLRYTLHTLSLLSPSQYYQDFKSSQQNSWTFHFLRHHILTFGPTWNKDDTMAGN